MDDVIRLLNVKNQRGADGVTKKVTEGRDVYCQVDSVSRSEFFEAGANGIRAEIVFRVNSAEYAGEEILEHHGTPYRIYRTYRSGTGTSRRRAVSSPDIVELYCERRQGLVK